MYLNLCEQLAFVRTQAYEAEVRAYRGYYMVVVRSPHLCRCIPVPRMVRTGRAGLDVAFELVEHMVREAAWA